MRSWRWCSLDASAADESKSRSDLRSAGVVGIDRIEDGAAAAATDAGGTSLCGGGIRNLWCRFWRRLRPGLETGSGEP